MVVVEMDVNVDGDVYKDGDVNGDRGDFIYVSEW